MKAVERQLLSMKLNEDSEDYNEVREIQEGPIVGSPQVSFLMCTLEVPKKLQHKFFALNFCYLYF